MLAGYDDDLAGQATRLSNRLRDALLHVHPALQDRATSRVDPTVLISLSWDARLGHPAVRDREH